MRIIISDEIGTFTLVDRQNLKDLLTLTSGKVYVLHMPNRAGKSTLTAKLAEAIRETEAKKVEAPKLATIRNLERPYGKAHRNRIRRGR